MMKLATLTAEATATASCFSWTWHCDMDKTTSAHAFEFYYDCVLDAERRGYTVELTRAHGASAPAGLVYKLTAKEK